MSFVKNFVEWFKLKPKIDSKNHNPPFFKEREIWWCRIGENIGTEISGKNRQFTRPVLIYKKITKYTFLAIPITTKLYNQNGKERVGSWFQKIILNTQTMLVLLNQIRILDYRRLDKIIVQIDEDDFRKVKAQFYKLY